MRIAELHIFQKDLPVRGGPYTMSSGALDAMDTTLVKLVTDSGHTGWGETCPLGPTYAPAHAKGARAALSEMGPGLIGTEVAPGAVYHRMNALLAGHNYAKAAIDIAVHDALARSLCVPVATLLGGALQAKLPSYYAIGVEAPDDAARIAQDKIAEGYPRLQLKVGGRDAEVDIAAIRKVSEVARSHGIRFAADANRGWSVGDAIMVSQACRDVPMVIEQPCDSLNEIRLLRSHLCHPLYLDEATTDLDTVLQIIGEGLADGFGMKLTRIGGLKPMSALREICAARNLPHTCDDAWGSDVIAAACLHIASTVRPDLMQGVWIAAPYITGHLDPDNPIMPLNGHLSLPEGPGLGIIVDEELLGPPVAIFD